MVKNRKMETLNERAYDYMAEEPRDFLDGTVAQISLMLIIADQDDIEFNAKDIKWLEDKVDGIVNNLIVFRREIKALK